MNFLPLTPDHAKEWDDIVLNSDDAWMFHLYDWLPLTEQAWNLESHSFLVESEGRLVGVFPLQKRKGSRILRSTFMGLGGPAVRNGIPEGLRSKVLHAMHTHAETLARESGCVSMEAHLPALSKTTLASRWQVNPLVNESHEDISTHTWMVDLTVPEDVLLSNCSYDARRSIRKATEAGYTIAPVRSVEDMHKYYDIHCETRRRTGVEPHPEQYFMGCYEVFCRRGYAATWKALDRNGEQVAFEMIGLFGKGALYWAGCCRTEHMDSGVNYLLQHHSMLWAKKQGAEWFENGEAFPNVREGKLRGLTVFKGKFGGTLHRVFKGRLMVPVGEVTGKRTVARLIVAMLRRISRRFQQETRP